MKMFRWNPEKNQKLLEERNISFEDILSAIQQGHLMDVLIHPNSSKYPNQKVFVVQLNHYIYCVPFVENETDYFLKTIYKSRKLTKRLLNRDIHEGDWYESS